MRTFIKRGLYVAIATAKRRPDGKWIFTTWRPDGPSGHDVFTDETLERETKYDWTECPFALPILDIWSRTEKWETGLKQCQFLIAWHRLTREYHRWDLARELDATPDLDTALALAPELLKRAAAEKKDD